MALAVAMTSTVPVPAGVVAVQLVVVAQLPVTVRAPKVNVVPPTAVEKFAPPMVTPVPPAGGPEFGVTLVTWGAVGGGEV